LTDCSIMASIPACGTKISTRRRHWVTIEVI
jgi:hypothetical protein